MNSFVIANSATQVLIQTNTNKTKTYKTGNNSLYRANVTVYQDTNVYCVFRLIIAAVMQNNLYFLTTGNSSLRDIGLSTCMHARTQTFNIKIQYIFNPFPTNVHVYANQYNLSDIIQFQIELIIP